MTTAGGPLRKLDLTRSTMVRAPVRALWGPLTDVRRWPAWFRDGAGRGGLASVEPLPYTPGAVVPTSPEVGQRFRLGFTNGLAAEFRVTYWVEPAQISLGMVKETRQKGQGIEGMILDLDFFPQRDGSTQLWFGALLLLEKGFRPGFLDRWPKREVKAWVDGFHQRVAAEAPSWPLPAKGQDDAPRAAPPAR